MEIDREILRYGSEVRPLVWRVSMRQVEPMSTPPRASQGLGRFDDPTIDSGEDAGGYAVLYCAETSEAAFLESLARFRPRLQELGEISNHVILEVQEREDLRQMVGRVTANWRIDWDLTSAQLAIHSRVVDLTNPAAIQFLREQLAPSIIALGLDDLDFSDVLGSDRRLTRAISRWIWSMHTESGEPMFSGIRYRSRFDPDAACLALYEGRFQRTSTPDVYEINLDTPGFQAAIDILRLTIA